MDVRKDRELYFKLDEFLQNNFTLPEAMNESPVDNIVKKSKRCPNCRSSKHAIRYLTYCDGSLQPVCNNCECDIKVDKMVDCIMCWKKSICKCPGKIFFRLTCVSHCCHCIEKFPLLLLETYHLRRAPPSPVSHIKYDTWGVTPNPTVEVAKGYSCYHCKTYFIIDNCNTSVYWMLQRWFCDKVVCQRTCASYFCQKVRDTAKLM
jgi:hypothetical protein